MESNRRFLGSILALVHLAVFAFALPTSLVDQIKAGHDKRSDKAIDNVGKSYLINDQYQPPSDWDQKIPKDKNLLIPSNVYNSPENVFDDKTMVDYEKSYRYDSNKDGLDEAIENAVLKSEMYGGNVNQYRRLDNRMKREVDLTPEEVLALLSLYDRRHRLNENYRYPWNREENEDLFNQQDDATEEDENWLDNPVMPHAGPYSRDVGPKYDVFQQNNRNLYDKRDRWGEFDGYRNKRFMVSKRHRLDPTRELRYMNGPNRDDFYTLSQLLSNQREPDVPVVQRLIL